MRKSLVSVVVCLTVFPSNLQAQTAPGPDSRRQPGSRSRFLPSDIDGKMVKEFNGAWQQCVLGTRDNEAVVLVLRDPDGSLRAQSGGRSNKSYEFTFTWSPDIVAVFHTHPNNRPPHPVGQDILIARKYDVPMFTLSRSGMFMYDPATNMVTKVRNGVDWLDLSSWAQTSDLAVTDPSRRKP
jgi:hypothetical protein